jgi:hypothetical protein
VIYRSVEADYPVLAKLTHKHTGLKDLFYAPVRSQDHRPKVADSLQTDDNQLRDQLTDLCTDPICAEHNRLKQRLAIFARVVHVLEVENAQLREQSQPGATIQPLQRRPR